MDRKKGRRWSSPARRDPARAALVLNGGIIPVMNGGDGVEDGVQQGTVKSAVRSKLRFPSCSGAESSLEMAAASGVVVEEVRSSPGSNEIAEEVRTGELRREVQGRSGEAPGLTKFWSFSPR
jgi:hypothetical protein